MRVKNNIRCHSRFRERHVFSRPLLTSKVIKKLTSNQTCLIYVVGLRIMPFRFTQIFLCRQVETIYGAVYLVNSFLPDVYVNF